jgi:hypothetical protein
MLIIAVHKMMKKMHSQYFLGYYHFFRLQAALIAEKPDMPCLTEE